MVTAEGLRPVKEVGMYGKIAVMELFRPKVIVVGVCWLVAMCKCFLELTNLLAVGTTGQLVGLTEDVCVFSCIVDRFLG